MVLGELVVSINGIIGKVDIVYLQVPQIVGLLVTEVNEVVNKMYVLLLLNVS